MKQLFILAFLLLSCTQEPTVNTITEVNELKELYGLYKNTNTTETLEIRRPNLFLHENTIQTIKHDYDNFYAISGEGKYTTFATIEEDYIMIITQGNYRGVFKRIQK